MSTLKENKMGVMPVGKLLFQMALPLALSMLVQALYNIVDSVFVSQISSDDNYALNAVSLAFPVQNIMIGIATGIGVGVNALMSRSLGERNYDDVKKICKNGIFLVFCGMILVALFGIFFAVPFMRMQSDIEDVVQYGADYIRIITIASFAIFGEVLLERFLQSTGRTTYTLYTQGTGAVLNIILDPIFIFETGEPIFGGAFTMPFGLGLDVSGAAIATVIGQLVAFLLAIYFNMRKNPEVSLNMRRFRPDGSAVGRILGIGVPSIIMVAIGSLMYTCMNLVLKRFGDLSSTAQTVFGAYFKLQSFIFMPIFGISNAALAIIAFNYGAKRPDRMMKTVRFACYACCSIMLVGTLAFRLFPELLLSFFNPDEKMLALGVPALRTICLCFIIAGACIVLGNVFQALGKSVYSMITSIARQIAVLIPTAYLLSLTGSVDAVWYAFPIAELASLIATVIMFVSLYRKKIRPLYNFTCNPE